MARTPTSKILPPPLLGPHVVRERLERSLDAALERRLTVLVAGAGFGKTSLLAAWAQAHTCAWYTVDAADASLPTLARGIGDALRLRLPGIPGDLLMALEGPGGPDAEEPRRARALASLVASALDDELQDELVLVVDDLQELGNQPSARLVDELTRQAPPHLHVLLASREAPPFPIERLRGRGQVLDVPAAALAFAEEELAEVAEALLGDPAPDLVPALHRLTEGWPAAVRLAVEALASLAPADRPAALEGLAHPGGPLFAYLAEEVLASEPAAVRELLRRAALVERFSPGLCEALGVEGAAEATEHLLSRGLFVEPREEGWFTLTPLIWDVASSVLPVAPDERETTLGHAVEWLLEQGHVEDALRAASAMDDQERVAAILRRSGEDLLAGGAVEAVLRGIDHLPAGAGTPDLDRLEGEAHQIRGNSERAFACLRRAAGDEGPLDPGLAWRLGLLHHLRGELDEAMTVYERATRGKGGRDEAMLLGWKAAVHWLRGEVGRCREAADRARDIATSAGDDRALAAAYTTQAMLAALEGDRRANDAYYLQALDAAERARDVLQVIRIRVNRSSRFSEEGEYASALRELDIAVRLAEATGFANFHALGVQNRGQARLGLGMLEEARADFEAARALYQRLHSRMVSYPLAGLGDVYRIRGDLALARAAYEEAMEVAEASGDVQGLVPALAGLAMTIVEERPEESIGLVERAVSQGPGMAHVQALLSLGWVAIATGRREGALEAAREAAAAARERRDRPGLADALTLGALAASEPGADAASLAEAASVWTDLGNPLAEAIARFVAVSLDPGAGSRAALERTRARLASLGVRVAAAAHAAGPLREVAAGEEAAVAIQSLGGFRLVRGGDVVSATEWQSKKARDLLKILVARRGRPVPRDFLMETLWPEESPEKVSNRLSVALTTVRTVMDPERGDGPDRYVIGDREAVLLDLAAVSLDVERFLAEAHSGLELLREGAPEALAVLREAEVAYTGDFLEEDLYDDWAAPLREECRSLYLSVARALAQAELAAGRYDEAVRYELRIIERDPYDEEAHLGLVRCLIDAGRHGEARRQYGTYRSRMEELGVEPAPFPSSTP